MKRKEEDVGQRDERRRGRKDGGMREGDSEGRMEGWRIG